MTDKCFTEKQLDNTSFSNFLELIHKSDQSTLGRSIELFARTSKSIKLRNISKKLHSELFGSSSPFYAEENGQYYTKPDIAKMCITNLDLTDSDFIVEPSAGYADFLSLLPKERSYGLDIDPKVSSVEKMDFFEYKFENATGENITVVGNPPFGNNSKLAVDFFQHSSKFAKKIAFILPRTFRKTTITNRINMNFWLEKEIILPKNSFYIENLDGTREDYDVPCVFQIWVKKNTPRSKVVEPLTHSDFEFVSRAEADFAVRRVGVHAGKVFDNDLYDQKGFKEPSHYFIKEKSPSVKQTFEKMWISVFNPSVDPNCVGFKYDTSGNPSISKAEIVKTYLKHK